VNCYIAELAVRAHADLHTRQPATNAQQKPMDSLSGEAIDRKDDVMVKRPSILSCKASVNLSGCSHRGKHAIIVRKIFFNKSETLR
jgi:hypothetical protein